jgi:hypothetical protein
MTEDWGPAVRSVHSPVTEIGCLGFKDPENAEVHGDRDTEMTVELIEDLELDSEPRQAPYDAAVVITTLFRSNLTRALHSVFAQTFSGSIQVLVGIENPTAEVAVLREAARDCPPSCVLSVLNLGYATAACRGGLYPGASSGALRTILSYAANSRRLAYLDESCWWAPDHLQTLCDALTGRDWAFSLRWYAEPQTHQPLCIDEWEAVGPDAGAFKPRFGGFVPPSCLMLDKVACEPVLRWWSFPLPGDARALSEDRNVFHFLREQYRWGTTRKATSYFELDPEDGMHRQRLDWIASKQASHAEPDARQPLTVPSTGSVPGTPQINH